MSYRRVIPRDFFNEAKLLKCLGAFLIEGERLGIRFSETGKPFDICQDNSDGSLYVSNYTAWINGVPLALFTSYNSKGNYPLYCGVMSQTVQALDDNGKLTPEMVSLGQELADAR